jgi:hypothetical protein
VIWRQAPAPLPHLSLCERTVCSLRNNLFFRLIVVHVVVVVVVVDDDDDEKSGKMPTIQISGFVS